MFSENDKQLNLKTGRAKSKIRFLPFSLSNKQPLQEKEREGGGSNKNWEGRTARSGQLGTGNWATEEPIGKLGIWEVEVKVKVKVVPSAKVVACFLLDFLL